MGKVYLLQKPFDPSLSLDIQIGQKIASLIYKNLLSISDYCEIMNRELPKENEGINVVQQYTTTQLQLLGQRSGVPIISVFPPL